MNVRMFLGHLQSKQVRSVDVAQWILKLPVDAYVFVKMDIEGAEHGLVRRMEKLGSHRRISRVSIECHGDCRDTMRRIRSWNVSIITEHVHKGMDQRQHLLKPISSKCNCS